MKDFKELLKNPQYLTIFITCLVIVIYFRILIYKEIKPKNWKEQRIECLKLGSDSARGKCLKIINE